MIRNTLRLGAALALTVAPALASAQTITFGSSTSDVSQLNVNIGSITLTQIGAVSNGQVEIFVDLLNPTYGFLNTGGQHTPLAFNVTGATALSASFTGPNATPTGGMFTAGGTTYTFSLNTSGGAATPFGTYNTAIDINPVDNGSSAAYFGDLRFILSGTGLTINSFGPTTVNGTSYYFAADITNGTNTGTVAWTAGTPGGGTGSVVPEPSTYLLLASGMIGLAGVARRKKLQG